MQGRGRPLQCITEHFPVLIKPLSVSILVQAGKAAGGTAFYSAVLPLSSRLEKFCSRPPGFPRKNFKFVTSVLGASPCGVELLSTGWEIKHVGNPRVSYGRRPFRTLVISYRGGVFVSSEFQAKGPVNIIYDPRIKPEG